MTREEAKEMLPIIQAFAEGKTIQIFSRDGWSDIPELNFSFPANYRIKLEPKYRPFKSQEECWNEMLKHQPFGWIVESATNHYKNIIILLEYNTMFHDNIVFKINYNLMFKNYKFTGGTPFGIKEEN